MPVTEQHDPGLVQRGLLLLGGITALIAVVLLIALRRPESSDTSASATSDLLVPIFAPTAPFPATPGRPLLVQLAGHLPSSEGWAIRHNDSLPLARLGSPHST